VISASHLGFSYAPGQAALHRISFALGAGERVVLLGANGAGKSTLLGLCNGLLRPCHGELRVGQVLFSYTNAGLRELRRKVATVLQDPSDQLFGATVLQDVAMGPVESGLAEAEARRLARQALEALGAGPLAERPIHALSVGEKKRVALAGVLVGGPSVLLLDEPTAGLDAPGEDALLAVLSARCAEGMTVLVATHDTGMVERWATRAMVLRAGRLVFDGGADTLLRDWPRATEGCGLREPALAAARMSR
jgi:cobalt/nickel transport system ATP-binding protein